MKHWIPGVLGGPWLEVLWLHYRFATIGDLNVFAAVAAAHGLDTLFRNLAVVGALTEAMRRGFKQGQQDVMLQLNPQRFEA